MRLELPDPPLTWDGGSLRPWASSDAPTLVEAWHDREIARWNPVPPDPTVERAAHWIDGCDTRLDADRSLDLCIVDDQHAIVGEVGLSGFDWERRAALIGYWVLPAGRGRGLATQSTAALAEWALTELDLHVLVARCATGNIASHTVAQRAGFAHVGDDGHDHQLWIRRALY